MGTWQTVPPVNPMGLSPAHSNCKLPLSTDTSLYRWAMYVYGGEVIHTWGGLWIFPHPNLKTLWLAVSNPGGLSEGWNVPEKVEFTGTSARSVEKQISAVITYRRNS